MLHSMRDMQSLKILAILSMCCLSLIAKESENTRYGFDAISLNGGGRALDLENSTTWGNPAALGTEHTDSYEVGISGFGVKPNMYASWIQSISDNSAISASYTIDPILDFEVQALSLGIALVPLRKVSIGFLGIGRRNETEKFSMDFSIGAHYRFNKLLSFAFDTRSLFETLDSTFSHPDSRRTFGAGTNILFGKSKTYATLDIQTPTLHKNNHIYTLGMGTIAGSNNNLKVQAGVNLFKRENKYTSTIGAGFKMQERFFDMLINAHYAIQDITIQGISSSTLSHAIGFGIILDAFLDQTPPVVSVRMDKSIILLNTQDPKTNALHFQLRAHDEKSNLKNWYLVLCSVEDDFKPKEAVKSFSGKGIPPKTVKWEGRGDDNERLPKGIYAYRFIVTDTSGNVNKTTWQLLEVQ